MYTFFEPKNHSGENRKAVFGSPILAKAVCRNAKGVQIIVVFQKSTRQEFYWVFRAKSPRSARRSWKYVNHFTRDFAYRPPYFDFGSFVAYHALMNRLDIVSQRIMYKKRISSLLAKTEHDSIFGDWQPQDPGRMTTDMSRRRAQHSRERRFPW